MKIEETEVLYEGTIEQGLLVRVRYPDGQRRQYQVADHGNGVSVLAYDRERGVAAMVCQWRPALAIAGADPWFMEIPGGLLEGDPEASARRELLEETGISAGPIDPIGVFWTMPGISTERVHLYLAAYAARDRLSPGGGLPEEGEHIEVREVSLRKLAEMARDGELCDLRSCFALQVLASREPELFI